MDFDRLPSRPVVKSTISAQADWERWLHENHFQNLTDGEGLQWTLQLSVDPLPGEENPRATLWVATLQLGADVNTETFIKTGTLDPIEDERMIGLIRGRTVPLRMKPVVHEAQGEKDAREMLTRVLPELRESIAKSKMRDIKRHLIGRWIDGQAVFGASPPTNSF